MKDYNVFPGPSRNPGMELRDWFAGLAMQALIASEPNPWVVARRAYEAADALMEVRNDG